MRVPYLPVRATAPLPSLGGSRLRLRPILAIRVSGPGTSQLLDGLLDTGADETLFQDGVADLIATHCERRSGEQNPSVRSRRVVVTRFGGPEVLQIVEGDPPDPRAGEARVRILATVVSYADLLMREGVHPEEPSSQGG